MKLKSITIRATETYEKKTHGEYVAIANVLGSTYGANTVEVTIDPERANQIVDILAIAVSESMSKAAADFASEIHSRIAGPAVEAVALEAAPSTEA